MKRIVVVYGSKYGNTRCYAEWIGKALSCEVVEYKDLVKEELPSYDTIIYGGGLYAGGVVGIDSLINNWDLIHDKEVILFTCGLADTSNAQNTNHIKAEIKKVVGEDKFAHLAVFHLRGGIDYKRLNLVHKMMMWMMYHMLKHKESTALRDEDKEMIATYGQRVDFREEASIDSLVAYVKG